MLFNNFTRLSAGNKAVCDLYIGDKRLYSLNVSIVKFANGLSAEVFEDETTKSLSGSNDLIKSRILHHDELLSNIIEFNDINIGILSIADYCFKDYTQLKDVNIASVEIVGEYAYLSCTFLSNVNVLSTEKIDSYGFKDCYSLSSMDLCAINEFGQYALNNCKNLSTVFIYIDNLPLVAANTFVGAGSSTPKNFTVVYVVDELYKSYIQDTNWSIINNLISSFTQPIVTFIKDEDSKEVVLTTLLNYGMSAVAPTVSRVGYEFRGWDDSYVDVTADVSCTALWRKMPLVSYFNNCRTDVPGLTANQFLSSEYLIWETDAHQNVVKDLCCSIDGWKFIEWQDAEGNALEETAFKSLTVDLSAYAFLNKYVDLSVWLKSDKLLQLGHIISGESDDLLSGDSKTSSEISALIPVIDGYTLSAWNPEDDAWNPIYSDTSISALYRPNIMSVDFYAKYTPKNSTELTIFVSCITANYGEIIPEFNPKDLCSEILSDYYILKNTWTPSDIFTRPITNDLTGLANGAYVKFANKIEINFVNAKATKQHQAGDMLTLTYKYEPGDVISYPYDLLVEENYTRTNVSPSNLDGTIVTEDTKSTDVNVTFTKNTFSVKNEDILNHYEDDLDPHHLSVLSAALSPTLVKDTDYDILYAWYDKDSASWSDFSLTPKDFYDADVISCKYKLSAANFEDDIREVLLSIDSVSATLTYKYLNFDDTESDNSQLSNLHVLKKNRADSDYESYTTLSVPQMTRSRKISSWYDPEGLHLKASKDGLISAEYELRYFHVILCSDGSIIRDDNVTCDTDAYQTASKEGWKFWNWKDSDGNNVDEKLRAVTADISADAHFEKYHTLSAWRIDNKQAQGTFTTFIGEYSFLCSDSSFGTLTSLVDPDLDIPADCKFSSWDPASWEYKDEDFGLSACCSLKEGNEYTVKFYVNDELKKEEAVKLNLSATAPEIDYKYSHDLYFKGWDTEEWKSVSRDLTVDAIMSSRYWLSYYYQTDSLFLTSCDYEENSAADYTEDIGEISSRYHYTTRGIVPASIEHVTSDMSAYILDEKNWFSDLSVSGPFADDLESHRLEVLSVKVNPSEVSETGWSVLYSKHGMNDWKAESPAYTDYGEYVTDVKISSVTDEVDDLISAVSWKIEEVRYDVSYIYKYLSSMTDSEAALTAVHSSILSNRADTPPTQVAAPNGSMVDIGDTVCSADFTGWQPASYGRVSSDLSIYALYSGKQLSVTYFDKDRNQISVEYPITYWTKSSYDDQDFITSYALPDGWKFIEWQDANGIKRSDEQLMRVQYDLSCYAFCKKWLSADLFQISSDSKEYLSTFMVLSDDVLLASQVQAALDTRPIEDMEFKNVLPVSSEADNGWKMTDDLELSAYYEGLSGEVWFYENYPAYDRLYFQSEADGSKISLNKVGTPYEVTLVSSENGTDWGSYTIGTFYTYPSVGSKFYLKKADSDTSDKFSKDLNNYYNFDIRGKIAAHGNILWLLDCTGQSLTCTDYCYYRMFYMCTSLTQAPELPATMLAYYCYCNMFRNCTSLTQAPELPATMLASNCYFGMFAGCTSLTSAPELPAINIKNSSYYEMFAWCTSLTSAPELPAKTLYDYCYDGMFYECSCLTHAPKLPATILGNYCYKKLFYNCNHLSVTAYPSGKQGAYQILSVDSTTANNWGVDMFTCTAGDFTGTPEAGVAYYCYGN